jgi:hypothetical protein
MSVAMYHPQTPLQPNDHSIISHILLSSLTTWSHKIIRHRSVNSHVQINNVQTLCVLRYWTEKEASTVVNIFHGARATNGLGTPHYQSFTITLRHITLGRTPLDERLARHREFYLTKHAIPNRLTSMHPVGIEPAIPSSERPQTHALDGAASGIGLWLQ